jgi:phage gp29-like protein
MPRTASQQVIQDEIAVRTYVEAALEVTRLLPHPSKVLSNISKQIDVFDLTIKQPDIAAVSRRYRDSIKKLHWDIARSTTRGQRAEWAKSVCESLPLNKIIPAAISARDYGYTVFETTWEKVGNQHLITNIEEKPRKWFKFDQANRLLLLTRDNPNGIIVDEKWPRKFIVVQHEASYDNPYGNGLLDEAYWYAKGLAANFEFHLGFLEDDGRDHWIGWAPAGSTNEYKDQVEDALRSLRNAAVAVVTEGTRVEKVENKGRTSTSDAYEIFKKSCRSTINMLWLGSDLATNAQGTGAYASSKSGMDIQSDAIEAGKELPEDLINTALRWMIEVNGIPDDGEKVAFYLFDPPDTSKEQADIDKSYAAATGRKPSDQLLAKRGYEPGDWQDPTPATSTGLPTAVQVFESGYDIDALISAADGLKKKY